MVKNVLRGLNVDCAGVVNMKHPDCTLPRGFWCCVHGDCKSDQCCYHGSAEEPNSMLYVCGICGDKFPRDSYLDGHIKRHHWEEYIGKISTNSKITSNRGTVSPPY